MISKLNKRDDIKKIIKKIATEPQIIADPKVVTSEDEPKETPRKRPKNVITKPQVIYSPQTKNESFPVNPVDMFDDTSISGIKDNYGSAVHNAADYDEREKYLLHAYVDNIKETDWIHAVYSIFKYLPFSKSQLGYNQFRNKVIDTKKEKKTTISQGRIFQ